MFLASTVLIGNFYFQEKQLLYAKLYTSSNSWLSKRFNVIVQTMKHVATNASTTCCHRLHGHVLDGICRWWSNLDLLASSCGDNDQRWLVD